MFRTRIRRRNLEVSQRRARELRINPKLIVPQKARMTF